MAIRCLLLIAAIQCLPGCLTMAVWGAFSPESREEYTRTATGRCHSVRILPGKENSALLLSMTVEGELQDWATPLSNRLTLLVEPSWLDIYSPRDLDVESIESIRLSWDRTRDDLEVSKTWVVVVVDGHDWDTSATFRVLPPESVEEDASTEIPVRLSEFGCEESEPSVFWRVVVTPLTASADLVTLPLQLLFFSITLATVGVG